MFITCFSLMQPIGDSCQYWLNLKKMKLTSPYYPNYFFADGKGCDWLITAPEGHIVALEFEYFMVRFKRI